jgi:hypothetical protein
LRRSGYRAAALIARACGPRISACCPCAEKRGRWLLLMSINIDTDGQSHHTEGFPLKALARCIFFR